MHPISQAARWSGHTRSCRPNYTGGEDNSRPPLETKVEVCPPEAIQGFKFQLGAL